jgi:hypothetical protein
MIACLDGRALNRAVGTEYTTVAFQRFEASRTTFAIIEELASVNGHSFRSLVATKRTANNRFKSYRAYFCHQLYQPNASIFSSTIELAVCPQLRCAFLSSTCANSGAP